MTWFCTVIFSMLICVSWGETNRKWDWDAVSKLLCLSLFLHDWKEEDKWDTFVLLQLHIKTSYIIIILHNPKSYISACCKKSVRFLQARKPAFWLLPNVK